jgi:hypothetical protein
MIIWDEILMDNIRIRWGVDQDWIVKVEVKYSGRVLWRGYVLQRGGYRGKRG